MRNEKGVPTAVPSAERDAFVPKRDFCYRDVSAPG